MGANQSSGKRPTSETPKAPPAKIQKVQKTFEVQEDSESDEEHLEKKVDGDEMDNNQEEEDEEYDEEEDEAEDEEEEEASDEEQEDEEEEDDDEEEKEEAQPANPFHVIVSDDTVETIKAAVKRDHEGGNEEPTNGTTKHVSFYNPDGVRELLATPLTSDGLKKIQENIRKIWDILEKAEESDDELKRLDCKLCEELVAFRILEIESGEPAELQKTEETPDVQVEATVDAQGAEVLQKEEEAPEAQVMVAEESDAQGAEVLQKIQDASETPQPIDNQAEKEEVNGNEKIDN